MTLPFTFCMSLQLQLPEHWLLSTFSFQGAPNSALKLIQVWYEDGYGLANARFLKYEMDNLPVLFGSELNISFVIFLAWDFYLCLLL